MGAAAAVRRHCSAYARRKSKAERAAKLAALLEASHHSDDVHRAAERASVNAFTNAKDAGASIQRAN